MARLLISLVALTTHAERDDGVVRTPPHSQDQQRCEESDPKDN